MSFRRLFARLLIPRFMFLAMVASSLAVLEGCATTTQATKEASAPTRKKKRIKKPKTIEGAPLAFNGDELDAPEVAGGNGAGDADDEQEQESGAFEITEEDSDLAAILLAEGHASFYHDSLAGRSTANGEKYDPNAKTCAHKTLPFGTMVVVEDTTTGKKSTCRINDRGPFVGGRIIDLSKRVARDLGMVDKGVTKVRIRILPKASS